MTCVLLMIILTKLARRVCLLLARQALLLVKGPVLALALLGTVPSHAASATHHVPRLAEVGARRERIAGF